MEETTTPQDLTPIPEPEKIIPLSEEAQYYLQIAAKWGNFIAIVGFVFCSLMLLGGLFAGSFIAKMSAIQGQTSPIPGAFLGFFYVFAALVSFMPCLYLYQFSSNAKKGVIFINAESITLAFSKLKSMFKFYGIMLIVLLSFYALIIIGMIVFAGTYSAFRQ